MTGYNSQIIGNKYCIQYETDSRENYRAVEELIRRQIDGKPATETQAIEALQTIREFCTQISFDDCENDKCPIGIWCMNDRRRTPEVWKTPQERTEEYERPD